MKTPLEVAFALRLTAREIQEGSFERSYGAYARSVYAEDAPDLDDDEDPNLADPEGGEAVSWCALGRVCKHLGIASPQGIGYNSAYVDREIYTMGTLVWKLWDEKRIHTAAFHMLRVAKNLETYTLEQEAPNRDQTIVDATRV
jgi:hypothetical protein